MLAIRLTNREDIILKNLKTGDMVIIKNKQKKVCGEKLYFDAPEHINIYRRPKE